MIAARAAHLARHDEPAQRRGVIGTLLLGGIGWTDRNQWLPAIGLALTIIAGGVLERFL